jgi:cellulose synthase/poly-beta-1,6-N-acetylglucosamine synthase-like glycosyltransferase
MEIYTDALTIFFFVYCLLYNAFLFFYVIVRHQTSSGLDAFAGHWPAKMYGPGEAWPDEVWWPIVTLMIPALNEGKVLYKTVENIFEQYYPGTLEVLIIDDGSDDNTPQVTAQIQQEFPDVYVLRRERPHARQGKGAALNAGLKFLFEKFPIVPKKSG